MPVEHIYAPFAVFVADKQSFRCKLKANLGRWLMEMEDFD